MRGATKSGPSVWLVGDVAHSDFAEAVALVRTTAAAGSALPEVILLAQSRPGAISVRDIERLRRSAPLAGVVSLLGSWCEGETRTGRPAAGVQRLYWYEFPSWWRRQLVLRAAGRCPDWASVEDVSPQISDGGFANELVAVETMCWDTAAALGDVLKSAGSKTIWTRPGKEIPEFSEVSAGIWEGGQLSDAEAVRLAAFCERLAKHNAPVVALLDFPRRDRCEIARRAGAAAVLGKPWSNVDLVATLRQFVDQARNGCISTSPCAA